MVRTVGLIGIISGLTNGGCSKLLGIEDLHPRDAAVPVDASIDMAPGCDASVAMVYATEDTMLLDEGGNMNPANRYGASDTIDLGLNGTSRLLFRFVLTQPMADALSVSGGTIDAKLTITLRPSGGLCGGTCPNAATSFQVFAATDGWNEGNGTSYSGASWYQRIGLTSTMQTPWQVPGGDGTADRSALALATDVVSMTQAMAAGPIEVSFALDGSARSEVLARVTSNRLSLMLVPTSGGTLYPYSRDALPTATQLAFSVCP